MFRCHHLILSAPELLMGDSACWLTGLHSNSVLQSPSGGSHVLFLDCCGSSCWLPSCSQSCSKSGKRSLWFSSFEVRESSCFTVSGCAISVDIVGHLFLTVGLSLLLQNKELRFWRGSCLSGSLVHPCSWMYLFLWRLFTDLIHSSSCTAFPF